MQLNSAIAGSREMRQGAPASRPEQIREKKTQRRGGVDRQEIQDRIVGGSRSAHWREAQARAAGGAHAPARPRLQSRLL